MVLGVVLLLAERAGRAAGLEELGEGGERVEVARAEGVGDLAQVAPERLGALAAAGLARLGERGLGEGRGAAAIAEGAPEAGSVRDEGASGTHIGRAIGLSAWALSQASMKIRRRSLRKVNQRSRSGA